MINLQDSSTEVSTKSDVSMRDSSSGANSSKKPTVKELDVCPKHDIAKALKLGLPNDVSLEDIMVRFAEKHILSK